MVQPFDPSERCYLAIRLSCSGGPDDAPVEEFDEPHPNRLQERIAHIAVRLGARVVANSPSEIVCVFSSAETAVRTSQEIHRTVNAKHPESGTYLRIAVFEPKDPPLDERYWSLSVAKTRQLARLARAGQTLACIQDFDLIDSSVLCVEREIDLTDWYDKDCSDREPVRRIIWQDDAPTRLAIAGPSSCPVTRVERLLLRWRDQQLEMTEGSGTVTIGRFSTSDISIDSDFTSRNHAHLDYAHSCFVLADCSRNGTYVTIDENEFYLHDDELILRGKGCISLGRRPSSSRGKLIYFVSEAAGPQSTLRERG